MISFTALRLAANFNGFYLAAAERPQHCALVGLSALAEGPMDSRSCVRASVRSFATRYLEIRASDFDDFLHKATS